MQGKGVVGCGGRGATVIGARSGKSLGCLVSSLDFILEVSMLDCGIMFILGRFLEGPEVWEVILGD